MSTKDAIIKLVESDKKYKDDNVLIRAIWKLYGEHHKANTIIRYRQRMRKAEKDKPKTRIKIRNYPMTLDDIPMISASEKPPKKDVKCPLPNSYNDYLKIDMAKNNKKLSKREADQIIRKIKNSSKYDT